MLKKDQYFKTVKRPYAPLFVSLIWEGYKNSANFKKILPTEFTLKEQVFVDGIFYYSNSEVKRASELCYKAWMKPSALPHLRREFAKRESELLSSAKSNFAAFYKAYEYYMPSLALIWLTEFPVLENIHKLLKNKITTQELEKILDILNIPLQDNFYKKEEFDLVRAQSLPRHVKKYEWLYSRYGEVHPYTLEQAKASLKKINKAKFLKEYRESKVHVKQCITMVKKLLPKDKRVIVDLMQYIVFYRTQRTDVINRSQYLAAPMLGKFAQKKGLTYKQVIHCTKQELLGKLPPVTIINNRMKHHALTMEGAKIRCFSGKDSLKIEKFLSDARVQVKEIKGNVACHGLVTGKVKVINSKADFGKITKGDILVTSMTNPQMVPIMKIAGAVVTDEGGITCHAAIISRELRKPCIIGTKIATQVLKDGDRVEVDANKGIVRKI